MCSKRGMRGSGAAATLVAGTVLATTTVAAMILSGCGGSGQGDAPGAGGMAPAPGDRAVAAAVEVRLVDHAGLMREVERHRGKVVVLDCWSTSCPPCVAEFPGLVTLAARHGDAVACLSLALEYDGVGEATDFVPPVRRFLEQVGAGRITNFVASEPADDLYAKLDLASVPAVCVWKPDGSLAVRFDDDMAFRELGRAFTYDDVERAVSKLLAE